MTIPKLALFTRTLFIAAFLAMPMSHAQGLKPVRDVQLPSGITLYDWAVIANRGDIPSLDTAAEAVRHIREHGAYVELLNIVWRASRAEALSPEHVNLENAGDRLPMLADARRRLGDWPDLVMAHARAAAFKGEYPSAHQALKNWIAVVPVTHPERQDIVALLLQADSDPMAIGKWVVSEPAALPIRKHPLPAPLQQFASQTGQVAACMGKPRIAIDIELSINGTWSAKGMEGKPYRLKAAYRVHDVGLLFSEGSGAANLTGHYLSSITGAMWYVSRVSGSGPTLDTRAETSNLRCNGQFFPLSSAKKVSWDFETLTVNTWSGPDAPENTRQRQLQSGSLEIVSKAMTAREATQRWPNLTLEGPTVSRWRIYEADLTNRAEFDLSTIKADQRQYYTPSSSVSRVLFVEGPNLPLAWEQWSKQLQSGWTISVRELP